MDNIRVKNITKSYADKIALDGVDFHANTGAIHGLLGPNGAGKTTLIRCINRIIIPDSGEILLNDVAIKQKDVFSIGYMPEERGLYKKMKVGEQIIFFAQLKGLSKKEAQVRAKLLLDEFNIIGWWNKKIEDLSKGMAQKIQFINTIIHKPKILILDEPFSGFDPINANMIKEKVLEYKNNGNLVILSTHDMSSVESICDQFTLINNAKNILSGDVSEIRNKYAIGRYRVSFEGKDMLFLNSLNKYCEYRDVSETNSLNTHLSFKLNHSTDIKNLITHTNANVNIIEFSKTLPSMNEIFIRAVGGEIL